MSSIMDEVFRRTGVTSGLLAHAVFCLCVLGLHPQDSQAAPPSNNPPLFATSTQLAQSHSHFDAAGDVNGDGYEDVIAGRPDIAHVYHGSASGISPTPVWSVDAASQNWPTDRSLVVAGAGDVNGDGYDDVIVGNRGEQVSGGYSDGKAFVYLGSASGLSTTPVWTGDEADSHYGSVVAGAGDVNGDGYDDIIVATPGARKSYNNFLSARLDSVGRVYLYLGSASGISAAASWQKSGDSGSAFGFTATGAGDVNGDGFDDIIIGAMWNGWEDRNTPGTGRAFVFHGSASGLEDTPGWSQTQPQGSTAANFGMAVSGAGDVNADGYDDVIVRGADIGEGGALDEKVFVFFGSANGLASTPDDFVQTVLGTVISYYPLSHAGDVDGDGHDDILLSMRSSPTSTGYQFVWLFQGSPTGFVKPAAWNQQHVNQEFAGENLSSAGDVNGDGYDDIVIPSSRPNGSYVFYGGPNPTPTADAQTVTTEQGVAVDITLTGSDDYDDPLTYAIVSQPSDGELGELGFGSREVTYSPGRDFVGTDSFEFSVTDPYGNTDTATVDITVPNEAPVFVEPTPEGSLSARVGSELSFRVAAEDPEGDRITYDVDPRLAGMSIDVLGGQFLWRPRPDQDGTHELELTADDSYQTTTRTIEVTVDPRETAGDAGTDAGTDAGADTGADTGTDTGTDAGADVGAYPDEDAAGDAGAASGQRDSGCGCASASPGSSGAMVFFVLIGLWALGFTRRLRNWSGE